ncbi:unnamed protein product [Chondrus crispus]|uniref:Uncharacterized protein n=1 Tax=Chondrus crispus TaxID=2769 RepID=R7QBA6_CHOCR|nr:unnamed protein product [Chondrus crispus]CDF35033.1 unnamed protein product [Chondrus crispus]|eukprot:XP_005714852.1 unnamed protein product [Chondrus crispus]
MTFLQFSLFRKKHAVVIVHDERGLARLLGRQVEKRREWELEPEEGLLRLGQEQYTVCVSIHEDVRRNALAGRSRVLPSSIPNHIPLTVGQECRCMRRRDAVVDFT